MGDEKHRPDSLKFQWRLYGTIVRASWATRLDKSVAYEIINNYYKDHGNSRASLGFLQKATGAKRTNVIASIRRLCESGVISVARRGLGTRPTEYNLNFERVAENASSPTHGTTTDFCADSPSGSPDGTTCSPPDGTSSGASGPPDGTQTGLRNRPKAALQEDGTINTHAPLADGLAASAAGARDPFEEFWTAYPRKHQKPKAKAAWAKLAPDAQLAERIIVAATSWSGHYAANPVEKKWMPAPANWLAGERYDEDLPDVYADPKEAAISKAKDRPAKVDKRAKPPPAADSEPEPSEWVGDVSRLVPPGRAVTTISRATTTEGKGGQTVAWVFFDFEPEAGGTIIGDVSHHFYLEHPDEDRQKAGQRHLCALMDATGRHDVKAMEEFIGAKVVVTVGRDGSLRYSAANDNQPMREAA